jgi:hypothetical protein
MKCTMTAENTMYLQRAKDVAHDILVFEYILLRYLYQRWRIDSCRKSDIATHIKH